MGAEDGKGTKPHDIMVHQCNSRQISGVSAHRVCAEAGAYATAHDLRYNTRVESKPRSPIVQDLIDSIYDPRATAKTLYDAATYNNIEVLFHVAMHSLTTEMTLRRLFDSFSTRKPLMRLICCYDRTPRRVLDAMIVADLPASDWVAVCALPQIDISVLEYLALRLGAVVALCEIAGHPNITATALVNLYKQADVHLLEVLFRRGDTPEDTLGRLLDDKRPAMRVATAKYRYLPDRLAQKAARDTHELVRQAAADNSEISFGDVAALAADPCFDVREAIAYRPDATSSALSVLSKDETMMLRRRAAQHPAVRRKDLVMLSFDQDATVSEAATRALRARTELVACSA